MYIKLGEKGSGFQPFKSGAQEFYKIRDKCLEKGQLFEDPEFGACDKSLFFKNKPERRLEWKRPKEIADNPRLIVEGISGSDVQQGNLGDCWFLSAMTCLTFKKALLEQVIPRDQTFADKYAGVFHFRFWQYGHWIDVAVDDRLPTYKNKLVYLSSASENEFWSALLEKAYAKLQGSYEALRQGYSSEAMKDFTGGITEVYTFTEENVPQNFYQIILKAHVRASLMCCSATGETKETESDKTGAILKNHAYSITRVQYVHVNTMKASGIIPLLRIRNPWGEMSNEWKGPWSAKYTGVFVQCSSSPEWRYIPDDEKEAIGLVQEKKGDFWMSFGDFIRYFNMVEMCHLNPVYYPDVDLGKSWGVMIHEGAWLKNVSAGGRLQFPEHFCNNPQYMMTLTEPDEEDEDGMCTVIVGLVQKNRRAKVGETGGYLLITYYIFKIEDEKDLPKPLNKDFFKYNATVAKGGPFTNLRDVSRRFKLPPGQYCIIPATYQKNQEGKFILRVFSEHSNAVVEHENEVKIEHSLQSSPTPHQEDLNHDEIAKKMFDKIAGEGEEVDWVGLKTVLNSVMKIVDKPERFVQSALLRVVGVRRESVFDNSPGFSDDACRSMVAMMDDDVTGKLVFDEFNHLWNDICLWTSVYKKHSKTKVGTLTTHELRDALKSAGYKINNRILNILLFRYADKNGTFSFESFIECAVKLKTMTEYFKGKDPQNKNIVSLTFAEWLEKTLYC